MSALNFILLIVFTITSLACGRSLGHSGRSNKNPTTAYRYDYKWSQAAFGWFKLHDIPATWDVARLKCQAEGAVLASPINAAIRNVMASWVPTKRGPSIHTGTHSTFSKGDFVSIEGVQLNRMPIPWANKEPNNLNNGQNCIYLYYASSKASLGDTECNTLLPYVCYKNYTKIDITECGTADSDYILEATTGSCYKYHKGPLVWSDAYMTCEAEGGYLAVINDETEASVIKEITNKHSKSIRRYDVLLIGFHDWGHFGSNFMTIHGEPLEDNYHKWSTLQPDNGTNARTGDAGEYCGSLYIPDNRLNDFYCHVPTVFLCEKSPKSLV